MARLALPIVTAQVGLMMMGVVDTLMVGRVSAAALAGVALGNLYAISIIIPMSGTLMLLDPLVAQAVGARDETGVARGIQRGMLLALPLALFASALLLPVVPVLRLFRQPAELIAMAAPYVIVSIIGVFPFLIFVVLRQSLQALGELRIMIVAIVLANLCNAALNWVFIFGHLGSPAMGVVGSAWATGVSRWLMALIVLALGWRRLRAALRPWHAESMRLAPLVQMLRLGVPIGLMQFLEYSVFSATALLMGTLGTRALAAHQIAINLASLTFMVPLGVGAAAAVRVGHAVGARDPEAARESARAALVCGVGFMCVSAMIFVVAPGLIARQYTSDVSVITLAVLLIPIAGVFQLFDGVQAVCAGALRGLGDTRVPFLINLAGFWLAGFPVSVWLGFHTRLGPVGLWWGFVAGLGAVGLLLLLRLRGRLRTTLARTSVEDEMVTVSSQG